MPSGKVGARDVAYLSGFHESVQRLERLFNRRGEIEAVQVIDIDVIGAESAQAGFAGLNEVIARGAEVVGAFSHAEARFGGNQHRAAATGDRLAENLFRGAVRVDVRSVKEVHAGFETNVDQARGLFHVAIAPRFEKLAASTKCACAKAEHRNLQTRIAELSEFHGAVDVLAFLADSDEFYTTVFAEAPQAIGSRSISG